MDSTLSGKMIAAMGIPGCGKSSVVRNLAVLYGDIVTAYYEPEENDACNPWPEAVHKRNYFGYFGSITWFRSMRIPGLFKAKNDAENGKIAFVDSYFDKLLVNYIGSDSLEWFLPKKDAYYSVVKQMAELDYKKLPNADIVLFFDINEDVWKTFLGKRNRKQDNEEEYLAQCFKLRRPMLEACEKYAKDFDKRLIIFKQSNDGPEHAAHKLQSILEEST